MSVFIVFCFYIRFCSLVVVLGGKGVFVRMNYWFIVCWSRVVFGKVAVFYVLFRGSC